jgi:hypothetical protein
LTSNSRILFKHFTFLLICEKANMKPWISIAVLSWLFCLFWLFWLFKIVK